MDPQLDQTIDQEEVMASPAPHEQAQTVQAGQKRKRENSEADINQDEQEGKDEQDEGDAKFDVNSLIPDNYEAVDDGEDEENDVDDDSDDTSDEPFDCPTHEEANEPFPQCAIYDDAIAELEEKVASISQRVSDCLEAHGCTSKIVKDLLSTAENLSETPATKKIMIAILGGAGVGKSSLLNAVTGKPDLAKSVSTISVLSKSLVLTKSQLSGGQSCTCVPTVYQDAFLRQTKDFGAMIYYYRPAQIKTLLKEIIKDYNAFAFEADEDWDEDTRTTAKKAHENAVRVLRTLFNDLPGFKTKADTVRCLEESYNHSNSELLGALVMDCELKLKHTVTRDYTEWHEARTVARLRNLIDPLMTSSGVFDQPALWPLAREVR